MNFCDILHGGGITVEIRNTSFFLYLLESAPVIPFISAYSGDMPLCKSNISVILDTELIECRTINPGVPIYD